MSAFPELVVFDLDFTLWDCGGTWCDCLTPPFSVRQQQIVDHHGRPVRLYDDVLDIFETCDRAAVPMALASRTEQPTWARELVRLLGIDSRFEFSEIYPATKRKHFAALQAATGIDHHRMLFFDDEMRNITAVSLLGVTCVLVENGMTDRIFQAGLQKFRSRGIA